MAFVRTTYGDFQSKAEGRDYIDYILDVCLPFRLKAIADSMTVVNMEINQFGNQNPSISVEMEGNSEGCPNPPHKKHGDGYKNLRVDKQHDYYLKVDTVPAAYVTLQVQYASGQGAHGGVLMPYKISFSYSDIRDALEDSIGQANGKGYALLHTGNAPTAHTNILTSEEKKTAKFTRYKNRFGAMLSAKVICREARCGKNEAPYETKLTQIENNGLSQLRAKVNVQKYKLKPADGVSLYCPSCEKKTLHVFPTD